MPRSAPFRQPAHRPAHSPSLCACAGQPGRSRPTPRAGGPAEGQVGPFAGQAACLRAPAADTGNWPAPAGHTHPTIRVLYLRAARAFLAGRSDRLGLRPLFRELIHPLLRSRPELCSAQGGGPSAAPPLPALLPRLLRGMRPCSVKLTGSGKEHPGRLPRPASPASSAGRSCQRSASASCPLLQGLPRVRQGAERLGP